MLALSLSKITLAFGTDVILRDVTFGINADTVTGIVGPNGTGKSSLLKIISGIFEPESGSLSIASGMHIGYLAQDKQVSSSRTVWEEAMSVFADIARLEQRLRSMEAEMGERAEDEAFIATYSRLSEEYDRVNGYSCEKRARAVLKGLGFPEAAFSQNAGSLSGGQKTRLALVRLLLEQPELLLLDEPTNHLDLDAITWLESYLRDYSGTVLIVSHDRFFLDALCSGIIDVEHHTCTYYSGNYTEYKRKKDEAEKLLRREYESQQEEMARYREIIRRFRSYATEAAIKKAKTWEKKLDKFEDAAIDKPENTDTVHFKLESSGGTGKEVLTVTDLGHRFDGDWLFRHVDLLIRQGERVAIIGPNGTGKTTMLRAISGELQPLEGEIRLGSRVAVSYYEQEHQSLSPDKSAFDEISDDFPTMTETEIRSVLGAFLLRGEEVFKPVAELSGGQRARILLAKFMLQHSNFLIMDEPTNHLDRDTREVLENAMLGFGGTLLVVSHDRYFLNRIATRILELGADGCTITEYLGDYDYYAEKKRKLAEPEEQPQEVVNRTAQKLEQKKERERLREKRSIQKRIDDAEALVERLEAELAGVEEDLANPDMYSQVGKAAELSKRYNELKNALDAAMAEWEEASALAE